MLLYDKQYPTWEMMHDMQVATAGLMPELSLLLSMTAEGMQVTSSDLQ